MTAASPARPFPAGCAAGGSGEGSGGGAVNDVAGALRARHGALRARGRRRLLALTAGGALLFVLSLARGATPLEFGAVAAALAGRAQDPRHERIVRGIRLPQATAAAAAGAGLSVAGCVMQSVLRNALASPVTLGVSQAAAFGASLALIAASGGGGPGRGGSRPLTASAGAFLFALAATLAVSYAATARRATPETTALTGVAVGAFASAGTMFLQYFADDAQLAAAVYWTFGDTARVGAAGALALAILPLCAGALFLRDARSLDALELGDETARSLGVAVAAVRFRALLLSAALTAALTALLGVIGFVGLVAPHLARRLVGTPHRHLLPASALAGATLLLAADLAARSLLPPHALPVSILTAAVGAPAFLVILHARGRR